MANSNAAVLAALGSGLNMLKMFMGSYRVFEKVEAEEIG